MVEPISAEEIWLNQQLKRGDSGIVFTVTATVTPILAELLLKLNTNNRPLFLGSSRYLGYVREILNNAWEHNGVPIIIARTRVLNDGQHRLKAATETGGTFTTQMCFGPTPESQQSIDIGIIRTVAGQLAIRGKPDSVNLASAIVKILTYDKTHRFTLMTAILRPTTGECIAFSDTHDLSGAICVGRALHKKLSVVHVGNGAALCHVLAGIDKMAAVKFFTALIKGSETSGAIYKLRELLIREAQVPKDKKMSDPAVAEYVILTWNSWRKGRSLRFPKLDTHHHPFPQPE